MSTSPDPSRRENWTKGGC